jgi:hypothetical protein
MSNPDLKIYKPNTYSHAFDLAFEVNGSSYEDGYKCLEHEKAAVVEALYERVASIFETEEYIEAFGCCDTYEEQ